MPEQRNTNDRQDGGTGCEHTVLVIATLNQSHTATAGIRRLFVTDALASGLPPHIAQVICGHQDISTTISYNTVYPDEVINAHRAFLVRRRSTRPSEEYRVPSDEEWQEFLGNFERRKVAFGTCGRAFATPCIHFPGRFRRVAR